MIWLSLFCFCNTPPLSSEHQQSCRSVCLGNLIFLLLRSIGGRSQASPSYPACFGPLPTYSLWTPLWVPVPRSSHQEHLPQFLRMGSSLYCTCSWHLNFSCMAGPRLTIILVVLRATQLMNPEILSSESTGIGCFLTMQS